MFDKMEQQLWEAKVKRRADALKQIWRETHRDYKGKMPNGTKTIMVLRQGGSCLVALANLTDQEIASRVKGYEA